MSVINQMLSDLESRRSPRNDRAILDELTQAHEFSNRRKEDHRRMLLGVVAGVILGVMGCAIVLGWGRISSEIAVRVTRDEGHAPAIADGSGAAKPLKSIPAMVYNERSSSTQAGLNRVAGSGQPPLGVETAQVSHPAQASALAHQSDAASVSSMAPEQVDTPSAVPDRTDSGAAAAETRVIAETMLVELEPIVPPAMPAESTPVVSRPGEFAMSPATLAAPDIADELEAILGDIDAGYLDKGVSALATLIEEHPDYQPARVAYVRHLMAVGEIDIALASLREGLSLDPTSVNYAKLLAHGLLAKGDVAAAVDVLTANPPTVEHDVGFHALLAALYQRLGRHADSVRSYQAILSQAPATGQWWTGLGISLAAQGEYRAAEAAFRRALGDQSLSQNLRQYAFSELTRLASSSG